MRRVHLLALPHTKTTADYSWCAFTQKVRKLSAMLVSTGWDVRLYGPAGSDAIAAENVAVVDEAWQRRMFGEPDLQAVFNDFDPGAAHWQEFNAACVAAMAERASPGDILGMTMGWSQKPVADAFPRLFAVETGIGYSGVWAPYRVFESHAWEHYLAARRETDDARFFDAVIPNSWDAAEFPAGTGAGGYYVYLGRFIRRKGVEIAVEATRRLGARLLVAGQGVTIDGPTLRGIDVAVTADHVEYVGVVGPAERARLLGDAIAAFTPSMYLEPFCGVHVEAQLVGTPVVTTDWGVFTETVEDGVNGYRCRTLADFVAAARAAPELDRAAIRERAHARWTTDVVRWQYDAYFRRLLTLEGDGWYTL